MGEDVSRSRNPYRLANLARLHRALLALLAHRSPDPPLPPNIEAFNRRPIRRLNLRSS
ncbi:MAG: hypothetical protein BWX68_02034 [Verrucomicrobia bacterium ADurb.Bin063]|nr:MAG: hypothetical protein BWX68_02034 [Verrucomicrobia bacterium ADurb.Bin063]